MNKEKADLSPFYEATGCIHIHSTYSDGSGTIAGISSAAADAGLDYIMMTDHNNLRALKNNEEGWYGPVLTIIGYEINDVDDSNHYLAFGLQEEIARNLSAAEYVKRVRENGGFGIIAHPDEQRDAMPEHPAYPWTTWHSKDYQGIEVWNQMSEWMEGLTPWNKVWRFINPRRSIIAPVQQTLDRWDRVNEERAVVGIGGVDAHAHKYKLLAGLLSVTVFRYKVQFKTVRTHLLMTEPLHPEMAAEKAKELIFEALLDCRVFVSNYYNGDARGFRCSAANQHGTAEIGGILPFSPDTRLNISLPEFATIRLIRNGSPVEEVEAGQHAFGIEKPGLYRVEVYRNKWAWIFSNHIRIMDEK